MTFDSAPGGLTTRDPARAGCNSRALGSSVLESSDHGSPSQPGLSTKGANGGWDAYTFERFVHDFLHVHDELAITIAEPMDVIDRQMDARIRRGHSKEFRPAWEWVCN